MRGGVGHPPLAAGGAEPTPLAGEGNETVPAARVAVDPEESTGEDAAVEERPELALDEPGNGTLFVPGVNAEGT